MGNGENQVPRGAKIARATLTLHVPRALRDAEGEANAVHRMLVNWNPAHGYGARPWAGGATPQIDLDDFEAESTAMDDARRFSEDGRGGMIRFDTVLEFDVTTAVQKWVDGHANHGFLLQSLGLGSGDEGQSLFMASSRFGDAALRPALTIETARPEGRWIYRNSGD